MLDVFLTTASKISVLLIFILVGYLLRVSRKLPDNAARVLSVLTTTVFTPAYNIKNLSASMTLEKIGGNLKLVGYGLVFILVIIVAARIASKLLAKNDFELRVEDLEEAVTDQTKALLINSPHNPTGSVIGSDEMKKIAEFAIKHDLIVVSDETYDQFLFEGEHVSISTMPGMKERTVIINSASKTFSMTGWRVGYAIAPKEAIKYMHKVHTNMSTCATSFVQVGAAEAYSKEEQFTKAMVEEFRIRRDILVKGLREIDGIKVAVPKGAFYLMFDVTAFGMTDREFCNKLLDRTGLATTPGESFGKYGRGFVRLSYACKREEIVEAVRRIKSFVEGLK